MSSAPSCVHEEQNRPSNASELISTRLSHNVLLQPSHIRTVSLSHALQLSVSQTSHLTSARWSPRSLGTAPHGRSRAMINTIIITHFANNHAESLDSIFSKTLTRFQFFFFTFVLTADKKHSFSSTHSSRLAMCALLGRSCCDVSLSFASFTTVSLGARVAVGVAVGVTNVLFGAARFCFLAAGGAPRLPFSRSICEYPLQWNKWASGEGIQLSNLCIIGALLSGASISRWRSGGKHDTKDAWAYGEKGWFHITPATSPELTSLAS